MCEADAPPLSPWNVSRQDRLPPAPLRTSPAANVPRAPAPARGFGTSCVASSFAVRLSVVPPPVASGPAPLRPVQTPPLKSAVNTTTTATRRARISAVTTRPRPYRIDASLCEDRGDARGRRQGDGRLRPDAGVQRRPADPDRGRRDPGPRRRRPLVHRRALGHLLPQPRARQRPGDRGGVGTALAPRSRRADHGDERPQPRARARAPRAAARPVHDAQVGQRRLGGGRGGDQDGAPVPPPVGRRAQVQGALALPCLPRRHRPGARGERLARAQEPVRAARPGLRPPAHARPVPAAVRRRAGRPRRRVRPARRAGDRAGRAGDDRGPRHRADPDVGRRRHPARRLPAGAPGALRPARHRARLRRDHHRLRPCRAALRRGALLDLARHLRLREGPHRRLRRALRDGAHRADRAGVLGLPWPGVRGRPHLRGQSGRVRGRPGGARGASRPRPRGECGRPRRAGARTAASAGGSPRGHRRRPRAGPPRRARVRGRPRHQGAVPGGRERRRQGAGGRPPPGPPPPREPLDGRARAAADDHGGRARRAARHPRGGADRGAGLRRRKLFARDC